jgi:CRP/FNR family transcriptional regulator, anaerobic regulatory protein
MSDNKNTSKAKITTCNACPLRANKRMRNFTAEELVFIQDFKAGEHSVKRGATILSERMSSDRVFTVLEGFAFRYKMLEDGRRQILNYSMPGDLIGIQSAMMSEMDHSVEALSDVRLCIFERKRFMELYREHPGLGYDLTWLAAREEQMLDEHLLSIGRRSALERAAYLLAFLSNRAVETGLSTGGSVMLPVTQSHVADTLGLSTVHTNKTLRKLAAAGFISWQDGGCAVLDSAGLNHIAKWEPGSKAARPFL